MENSDQYVLAMRGIKKSFGEVEVLKNVDFFLRKGEIHALVGENGAGKSTLIKGLIGIYSFNEGTVLLNQKQVHFRDANEALDSGISVVFQELSQIGELTVAENIFLRKRTRSLGVLNRKELISQAESVLREYNIDIDPKSCVEQLSVAKRQLLEIVKAVSKKPKILILDEPTSSLTEMETQTLFGILRRLKAEGTSVIYITHRMNEVFQMADRITILRDGKNVCDSAVSDIDFDTVVKHMVGRKITLFNAKKDGCAPVNPEVVLEVKQLCREGEFENISFQLRRGEVLGFAGLVGSGRTELMQILFGIRKASSGQVLLNGQDITNKPTSYIIDAGMAMVPESRHLQGLFLMHSVEKNIGITSLRKLSKAIAVNTKQMTVLANDMIKKLNIATDSPRKTAGLLSGGSQQKVVLAKWLAVHPKLLILDEPTNGIDVQSKSEIHKIIAELSKSGTSIILISSEMPELINNSDRVLVINSNRIIGETDSHASQEDIMEMILKDKLMEKHAGGEVS